jgi:hypothetical protein
MKTTPLATITLAVFSTFALLAFAGGQEHVASLAGHYTSLGASALMAADSGQMRSAGIADQVHPIILVPASGNEVHTAGPQTIWLDGSVSGRPWWIQTRQAR